MTRRRAGRRDAPEPEPDRPDPEAAANPEPESEADELQIIDFIADELGLARAQIDAGLLGLAEGTVRRRLAVLEADGVTSDEETDALRLLLAETLWRRDARSARAAPSRRSGRPARSGGCRLRCSSRRRRWPQRVRAIGPRAHRSDC